MTENQATLTKTQHPGQLGACCENEIHVSESIRIIQAWFIQKCHNPFLTLQGHVHHIDSRELKYMKFISCAYQIHLSSDSYMKGEARLRDKMPLGTSAWDICWGIVWIVSFLHGRSEIETKQWGFQNKEMGCGLHSQFPSEVFHMEEENFLKWVRERGEDLLSAINPSGCDSFEEHCNSDSGFSSGVEPTVFSKLHGTVLLRIWREW